MMRIFGINTLSFNNGEGARLVLFLQGCGHHCDDCQNPESLDFNSGEEKSVEELADYITGRLEQYPLDGITLSGGDPFYQQEECVKLLDLLPDTNVWIYTGFLYDEIKDTELAKRADVIVDGPFIKELRCEGFLYGSSNQRIIRKDI